MVSTLTSALSTPGRKPRSGRYLQFHPLRPAAGASAPAVFARRHHPRPAVQDRSGYGRAGGMQNDSSEPKGQGAELQRARFARPHRNADRRPDGQPLAWYGGDRGNKNRIAHDLELPLVAAAPLPAGDLARTVTNTHAVSCFAQSHLMQATRSTRMPSIAASTCRFFASDASSSAIRARRASSRPSAASDTCSPFQLSGSDSHPLDRPALTATFVMRL